jgi:hypothetical protein
MELHIRDAYALPQYQTIDVFVYSEKEDENKIEI